MKKLKNVFVALLLAATVTLPVSATSETHLPRVVDEADLLNSEEEAMLEDELNDISEDLEFDVVVVTVDSLEGQSAEAYADDYYDYNGYGYGEDYDGALLLISMEYRDWHISTCGYGIKALHDNNLRRMEDKILPYLSEGDYYRAFNTFGTMCEQYVTEARTTSGAAKGINPFTLFLGCLVFGAVFACIPLWSMKKQMKTVNARYEASDYILRDRIMITRSRDAFLYRNVTRQKKPEPNTSTTHRSSSGRSHGGRGGKF